MAFRATNNWRRVLAQHGCSNRTFATSATNTAKSSSSKMNWDHAPIYVVCGMVGIALMIAGHTSWVQLRHSPSVNVNKKRRESMAEVDDPLHASASGQKFIDGFFLRKVGHIQEDPRNLPNPTRKQASK